MEDGAGPEVPTRRSHDPVRPTRVSVLPRRMSVLPSEVPPSTADGRWVLGPVDDGPGGTRVEHGWNTPHNWCLSNIGMTFRLGFRRESQRSLSQPTSATSSVQVPALRHPNPEPFTSPTRRWREVGPDLHPLPPRVRHGGLFSSSTASRPRKPPTPETCVSKGGTPT